MLHIKVTDYLYKVTLYEVPILAIVSELRSRIFDNNCDLADVIKRLSPKIKLSNVAGIKFSEFGTRRRFSYNVQDIVLLRSEAIEVVKYRNGLILKQNLMSTL